MPGFQAKNWQMLLQSQEQMTKRVSRPSGSEASPSVSPVAVEPLALGRFWVSGLLPGVQGRDELGHPPEENRALQ